MPTTSIQGTLSSTSDEIEIPTGPNGAVGIQIVLTGTATLQFTTTSDGTTHNAILASPNGGGALVSSATASGAWRVNAVSTQSLRVKPSAISGSAVVTLIAQPGQVPTTPQGSSAVIGTVAIDQTTPGTTNLVAVTSANYTSAPAVTRPNDTTPYTAGDVVGGVITFTNAGPAAGGVYITDADLRIALSAVPSGMTSFTLYLYSVTPPSALADNAPWTYAAPDAAVFLGSVSLGSPALPVSGGAGLFVQNSQINKKVLLGASTSLFAYLVTATGYTPAAQTVYTPRLQLLGV